MPTAYEMTQTALRAAPKTWLITGVAGFIGSNLLEALLQLDQRVVGLDNFSTGKRANLDEVRAAVAPAQWARFEFHEGDIRELAVCQTVCRGVDYVLHQAALGSVPRSIDNPLLTHENNVTGHLHMLIAARDQKVKRFVYAASSSTYGDHPGLPKIEERIGRLLSPYAVSKYVAELYSDVFAMHYGLESIGLRYFNVFGPRQAPDGAYAAVIPKWTSALIRNQPIEINGTGETSRDFCYVQNAVQADILAATVTNPAAINQVYNVAVNARTSLNQLYDALRTRLAPRHPQVRDAKPIYRDFRPGDILHSQADVAKAGRLLGYVPTHTLEQGLDLAVGWYEKKLGADETSA